MTVIRTELETKMLHRVRKHMIISFAAFFGGVVVIAVLAMVAHTLNLPKWAGGAGVALAILAIPGVGLWSTFKNLRCPACEGTVGFQVSANFSLLGARASKNCRHCGKKIFADDIARRMFVLMFVGFGIGILLGIVRLLVGR